MPQQRCSPLCSTSSTSSSISLRRTLSFSCGGTASETKVSTSVVPVLTSDISPFQNFTRTAWSN